MTVRKSMLMAIASAGVAVAAPVIGAQGSQSVGLTANGFMQSVFVSVLGGFGPTGSQLYFFSDAFDPITGVFAPNKKIAIGPQLQRVNGAPYVAATNSTNIGTFSPGSQLVFGVLMPDKSWRYTGALSNAGQVAIRGTVNARYTTNQLAVAGGSSQMYGWDLNNSSHYDYNDILFSVDAVSQATVTPEPASMTLIGLGLAGLGGIVRRRRKNEKS